MKKTMKKIVPFLVAMLIGGSIGAMLTKLLLLVDATPGNGEEGGGMTFFINFSASFLLLIGAAFLQIILHEAGHLLAGLLTGYRFVSFRIFSFILVRENGRFRVRRFDIPGTGGQCLMMPPKPYTKAAYGWYLMGGVLLNVLISLLALGYLAFQGIQQLFPDIFLFLLGLSGIFFAVMNGLPLKLGGIPNDGYHFWFCRHEVRFRDDFYRMLKVHALQCEGETLANMPKQWFPVPPIVDGSVGSVMPLLLHASWCVANFDFVSALDALAKLKPHIAETPLLYRLEWKCEYLFCLLMVHGKSIEAQELNCSELRDYVGKSMRFQIGKVRLAHAFALWMEDDLDKADGLKMAAQSLALKAPNRGEAVQELEIINRVALHYFETKMQLDFSTP